MILNVSFIGSVQSVMANCRHKHRDCGHCATGAAQTGARCPVSTPPLAAAASLIWVGFFIIIIAVSLSRPQLKCSLGHKVTSIKAFAEASKVFQRSYEQISNKIQLYAGFCPVCTGVVFWSGSVRLCSAPGLAPQLPSPRTRTMELTNLISKSSPMPQLHTSWKHSSKYLQTDKETLHWQATVIHYRG